MSPRLEDSETPRSNNWHELGLKISKRAKKRSRETEMFLLQADLREDLKSYALSMEKRYRKMLDEDIKRERQKLLEVKNEHTD